MDRKLVIVENWVSLNVIASTKVNQSAIKILLVRLPYSVTVCSVITLRDDNRPSA